MTSFAALWALRKRDGDPESMDNTPLEQSAPVVAALRSGTPAGDELGALLAAGTPAEEADVVRAARLIERAGAREWTTAAADEHLAAALTALDEAPGIAAEAHQDLVDLARYVLARDR